MSFKYFLFVNLLLPDVRKAPIHYITLERFSFQFTLHAQVGLYIFGRVYCCTHILA